MGYSNDPIVPQDPTVAPGCAVSEAGAAQRVIQLTLEQAAGVCMAGSLLRHHQLD